MTSSSAIKGRWWFLVPILAVLLGAVGFVQTTSGHTAARQSGAPATAASPGTLPDKGTYRGIPAGITGDGHPYLGTATAPMTIEEYTDFLCPFCARHTTQTMPPLLEKYVAAGLVKYVLHDMPLASLHPTAARGHAAALCVAEQGATAFWAMHEELFKSQEQWRSLPDPSTYLAGVARRVGADPGAYDQCVSSGRTDALVQQGVAEGRALGFDGTPSFRLLQADRSYTLVGAQPLDVFSQWIDAIFAGKEPPQEPKAEEKPAELPLWANAKGLAPDPNRPGFNMAGDPYRGNAEAKMVVVEFSNFQCPACRQHEMEVQPALDKALVESGEVMWVFKNLPLRSLRQSAVAAVAAECAGDQGRYWEMSRLLFETQGQWAVESPDPVLAGLAGQAGMDVGRFSACLSSRQGLERVLEDMYDAQGAASTTPTFVVLVGGRGTLLKGSSPAEQFIATLRGLMRLDGTAPSPVSGGR